MRKREREEVVADFYLTDEKRKELQNRGVKLPSRPYFSNDWLCAAMFFLYFFKSVFFDGVSDVLSVSSVKTFARKHLAFCCKIVSRHFYYILSLYINKTTRMVSTIRSSGLSLYFFEGSINLDFGVLFAFSSTRSLQIYSSAPPLRLQSRLLARSIKPSRDTTRPHTRSPLSPFLRSSHTSRTALPPLP